MRNITYLELIIIVISLLIIVFCFNNIYDQNFSVKKELNSEKSDSLFIISSIIRKDLDSYTSGFIPGKSNYSFYILDSVIKPRFSEKLIQYTVENKTFIRKENAEITHKISIIDQFEIRKEGNLFFAYFGNNSMYVEIVEHFPEMDPVEVY